MYAVSWIRCFGPEHEGAAVIDDATHGDPEELAKDMKGEV